MTLATMSGHQCTFVQDNLALPKYTSPIVAKFLKPLCAAYTDLATAYTNNSAPELRAAVTKYQVMR